MAMNRSNKLAAGGAALLVVVAGGWLMLSRVADAKAEERVAGLLDQYEVRDGVSWAKVSASPFGSSVRFTLLSTSPKPTCARVNGSQGLSSEAGRRCRPLSSHRT